MLSCLEGDLCSISYLVSSFSRVAVLSTFDSRSSASSSMLVIGGAQASEGASDTVLAVKLLLRLATGKLCSMCELKVRMTGTLSEKQLRFYVWRRLLSRFDCPLYEQTEIEHQHHVCLFLQRYIVHWLFVNVT